MTAKSLSIEGGALAVPEPDLGGVRAYKGIPYAAARARGIVVVTLNHRLNALGFLAHPELTAESDQRASGNYGLLDWSRRFDGGTQRRRLRRRSRKVTLAGESAGSEAASALMASPLAKGLFRSVIGESGAMFASPVRAPASLAKAEAAGLDFMRKAGAKTLAELRALPAEAILAAAPGLGFRPIVDGWFLPRPPAEIFAAGEQSDVPLTAGVEQG